MFNSYDNFIAEWCLNTRALEEVKTYNETDDEFRWGGKKNQLYNLPKKTIFLFQTDKFLK